MTVYKSAPTRKAWQILWAFPILVVFGLFDGDSLERILVVATIFTFIGFAIGVLQDMVYEIIFLDTGIIIKDRRGYFKLRKIQINYNDLQVAYRPMIVSQGITNVCMELAQATVQSIASGDMAVSGFNRKADTYVLKPALIGWDEEIIAQVADELRQRGVHLMNEDEWLAAIMLPKIWTGRLT